MTKPLIFVSGAYSGDVENNIKHAEEISAKLWKLGYSVVCPHLNTANFEKYEIEYQDFIDGYLEILRRCDGVVMLNNWRDSNGARIENSYANTIPILVTNEDDLGVLEILFQHGFIGGK